jgi:hypothetical protein
MSEKIRQRFHVTDGIGVVDRQHSAGERERRVYNDEAAARGTTAAMVVIGSRSRVSGARGSWLGVP